MDEKRCHHYAEQGATAAAAAAGSFELEHSPPRHHSPPPAHPAGDGVIDADELRAALVTLGHPAPSDAALQVRAQGMAQRIAALSSGQQVPCWCCLVRAQL